MIGKRIRMDRILNRNTKKTIIVPMDHGLSMGPIPGLENMATMINKVTLGGANAVVVHKGVVKSGYRGYGKDVGLLVHITGSTELAPDPFAKVPICTVEEAVKLGADGISVHVNMGANTETEMLRHLGQVSNECEEWEIPLLAMMYARGPKIKNQKDPQTIAFIARVAYELGVDIIKINYTGDVDSFRKVVECVDVPLVVAGGEKGDTKEILAMVKETIEAGGSGVSIGRNIFQHPEPSKVVRAIAKIVHENHSVDEAMKAAELKV